MALGSVLVALSLAGPAYAAKSGGGVVTGTMGFQPGIAPLGPTCQASTVPPFELSSRAFVVDTQIVGYAGPLTIKLSGSALCQTFSTGSGDLEATITGYNDVNGSRIDCPEEADQAAGQRLSGSFLRVFTHMRLRLAGPCMINRFGTSNIGFAGELSFVPVGLDEGRPVGILEPVTAAHLRGPFVITPG